MSFTFCREHQLRGPDQSEHAELMIYREVAADDLGILVVRIDQVDRLAARRAARYRGRLRIGVRDERNVVGRVEADGQVRELHAGVPVLVREPHVRRAAGEQPDASADLALGRCAVGEIPVEPDSRGPHHWRRGDVGRIAEVRDRHRIGERLHGEVRHVHPKAVGQREAVGHAPPVARIEAELPHRELGRLLRIRGVREVVRVGAGDAVREVVDVGELVIAVVALDEEVPELVELVVAADGERVLLP